jgi:hypothetical protein
MCGDEWQTSDSRADSRGIFDGLKSYGEVAEGEEERAAQADSKPRANYVVVCCTA